MPPSSNLLVLLVISLSSLSFCLQNTYMCYRDARMPILVPDACKSVIRTVLAQDYAQGYVTFGRVTAPGVMELPLTWYGVHLTVPTNCVMQMNGIIGERQTLKLRNTADPLKVLAEICVNGAQRRGGEVALGPNFVVWFELYALSDNDYERILRTRPGEATGNKTSGGFLSGPGLGRGSTLNGSVS